MFEVQTLITMLSAFIATLYVVYKLIIHFKNPAISQIVDQKMNDKLDKLDKTITKLIEKDNALEMRVLELGSVADSNTKNIHRLEQDHKEYTSLIYNKIDHMHAEIITIIRDQHKN